MSQPPLLIKPPPAVKAVLEKTAGFVAKNGRSFEIRILNSAKGQTAKFAFLHATSPFHAYYEDRVRHYAAGGSGAAEEEDEDDDDNGTKKKTTTTTEGTSGDGGKGDDKKEGEKENAPSGATDTGKSDDATTDADKSTTTAVQRRAKKASVPDPVARTLLAQRHAIRAQDQSRRAALDALAAAKRAATADGGTGTSTSTGNAVDLGLAQRERELPTVVQPPPPLPYTALTAPSHLTAGQVEVVKLTAQYAALASLSSSTGGSQKKSSFVKILTETEWTNEAVFGFLQPRNVAFAYFAALVDVYKLILGQTAGGGTGTATGTGGTGGDAKAGTQSKAGTTETERTGNDRLPEWRSIIAAATTARTTGNDDDPLPAAATAQALSVAAYRAEYDRHVEERRWRLRQQATAADGGGMMGGGGGTVVRIDWHDFVVVETIDFATEEVVDTVAPRPRALFEDEANNNINKKTKTTANAGGGARDEGGDKKPAAREGEAEENAEVRFARAQAALAGDATAGDHDDDDDEPIQIDATYQAKVVSTTDSKQTAAATHVVDPISGRSVPVEHLSEHMRIQLLDPNWSKQRKTFLDKQRESNIVGGDAIAANISGFAKEKGELFGSSEQELLDREASKQRLAEANKLIREQAQQQQQQQQAKTVAGAAVGASMPPPPPVQPAAAAAAPNHPRPSGLEAAPAPKRARVDAPAAPAVGGAAVPPPPPPPPPPAQPAVAAPMAPVPAAPAVPPPPPPHGGPMAPIAPPAPAGQTDTILAPEAFIASLSDPTDVEVTVQTPADSTNASWNLDGRSVSVRVDVTTGTVKTIKEACRSELGGMATNKMQLRVPGAGFLKDKDGLAALNIGPGTTLDLVPKKRGGR